MITRLTVWGAPRCAPVFLVLMIVSLVCAAAPPSAAGQTLTPERRKAIETLLEVTGAVEHARWAAEQTGGEALSALLKAKPDIPPRAVELTREVFGKALDEFLESPTGILPMLVDVYARHYTHEEVVELTGFYRTPLGQKVAKTQPLLSRETARLMEGQFERRLPHIMRELQRRLRHEGLVP